MLRHPALLPAKGPRRLTARPFPSKQETGSIFYRESDQVTAKTGGHQHWFHIKESNRMPFSEAWSTQMLKLPVRLLISHSNMWLSNKQGFPEIWGKLWKWKRQTKTNRKSQPTWKLRPKDNKRQNQSKTKNKILISSERKEKKFQLWNKERLLERRPQ